MVAVGGLDNVSIAGLSGGIVAPVLKFTDHLALVYVLVQSAFSAVGGIVCSELGEAVLGCLPGFPVGEQLLCLCLCSGICGVGSAVRGAVLIRILIVLRRNQDMAHVDSVVVVFVSGQEVEDIVAAVCVGDGRHVACFTGTVKEPVHKQGVDIIIAVAGMQGGVGVFIGRLGAIDGKFQSFVRITLLRGGGGDHRICVGLRVLQCLLVNGSLLFLGDFLRLFVLILRSSCLGLVIAGTEIVGAIGGCGVFCGILVILRLDLLIGKGALVLELVGILRSRGAQPLISQIGILAAALAVNLVEIIVEGLEAVVLDLGLQLLQAVLYGLLAFSGKRVACGLRLIVNGVVKLCRFSGALHEIVRPCLAGLLVIDLLVNGLGGIRHKVAQIGAVVLIERVDRVVIIVAEFHGGQLVITGAQGNGMLGYGLGPDDKAVEQPDADGQYQNEGNDADGSAPGLSLLFLGSLYLLGALADFGQRRPLFSFT